MLSAIVLAAGQSRRMGTQKLLLPWAGQTMIGHVVDQLSTAGEQNPIGRVLVVVSGAQPQANSPIENGNLSPDAIAISKALEGKPIRLVVNPDPTGEMLSSIRCGLRALSADCTGALIALGDQPTVRNELIRELISEHERSPKQILAPVHAGKRGHPIVLPSRFFQIVLSQFDTIGLRGLLEVHANDVSEIAVNDATVLDDLDMPADYQRAIERQQSSHWQTP